MLQLRYSRVKLQAKIKLKQKKPKWVFFICFGIEFIRFFGDPYRKSLTFIVPCIGRNVLNFANLIFNVVQKRRGFAEKNPDPQKKNPKSIFIDCDFFAVKFF